MAADTHFPAFDYRSFLCIAFRHNNNRYALLFCGNTNRKHSAYTVYFTVQSELSHYEHIFEDFFW